MAKEDKHIFEKDERVLCYHGPFIYEAKVNIFFSGLYFFFVANVIRK